MPPKPDLDFFRQALDLKDLLTNLQPEVPEFWPPDDADVAQLALRCKQILDGIDAWEIETAGRPLVDRRKGLVSTPDARRMLVKSLSLSDEGDMSILFVEDGPKRIGIEMRAIVDEFQGMLRHPEFVLFWCDEDDLEAETQHIAHVALPEKGAAWYMLSALRDDVREGREAVKG